MLRAVSRSAGVSTPRGTVSTIGDVDAHAGFERPQLLELLARSSGEGGSSTKRSSAARR